MIAVPATIAAGNFAASAIVNAIKTLYGTVQTIDSFIDGLIDKMKASANQMVVASGKVLEGAKFGFGIGYVVPTAIIAIGQLLLGNPLAAAKVVGTAAIATNPISMTCAAIGAIYFGWNALSDDERNAIIERIQTGLDIGAELVRSIVSFVVRQLKQLLSPENLDKFKKFIGEAAALFGRTLADVTRSIKDKAVQVATTVAGTIKDTTGTIVDGVSHGAASVGEVLADATDSIADKVVTKRRVAKKATQAVAEAKAAHKQLSAPYPVQPKPEGEA